MDPIFSTPPVLPAPLAWSVLALTAGTLAFLIVLAAHRTRLMLLSRGQGPSESLCWEGPLPRVTVQLPVFNEASVVVRLLDAVAALDYPRDRIQVQLLDDSTDVTTRYAATRVAELRENGLQIQHLHRKDRTGFKAGALAQAMEYATGDFLLILDADFVPKPDLIHRLLPPFMDHGVAMVQARWDHLNESRSLLTRCQALLLDAHFFFEQGGRYSGGLFMSFNGTAGMWRRKALEDSGGWSWDTLTEDLDLSYRCQMRGWRFVFLRDVGVPAELPEDQRALEVQQKRWAQGGVQTGKKILPRLVAWGPGAFPLRIQAEGVAHLMGHLAHPFTLLLGLLLLPSAVARSSLELDRFLWLDAAVFAGATLSFLTVYVMAGRVRGRPLWRLVGRAVATLALGVGLTASVTRAVLRGLLGGSKDPFIRTPKRGEGTHRYRPLAQWGDAALKAGLVTWMGLGVVGALVWGYVATLPFLLLFGGGYLWLLFGSLREFFSPGTGRSAVTPHPIPDASQAASREAAGKAEHQPTGVIP
jgi:cellulose synthase/poly-beta-1,6-N-acetylglucosamine synthase-like glycosyltransferase